MFKKDSLLPHIRLWNGKRTAEILLLIVFCILLLAGCRESPALQNIVYNQDNAEDISQVDSMINNKEDNEETDEKISALKEQESEKKRDWDNDIAQQGDKTTADEQAADINYDKNTENQYNNNQTWSDNEKDSQGGSGNNSVSDPNGTSNNNNGGISENNQNGAGSYDENATRQVVTADGTYIEVPENVDSVSAVGEAAVLVEMLGGSGRLTATSESFKGSSLSQSIFGSEDAAVLWEDEGETQISDANFNALLEKHPDVCFEISGDMSFSESQIAALEAAGITYVALPSLDSATGISQSISLIGQILGDKSSGGGVNAVEKAEKWQQWYERLMKDVSSRVSPYAANGVNYDNTQDGTIKTLSGVSGSGVNSLFVSDWDDNALYSLYSSTVGCVLSSQGMAVTTKGYTDSPLSYFMSMGGVNNMAASAIEGGVLKSEKVYINTFNAASHRTEISGSLSYNDSSNAKTRMTNNLGGESFPAIIAASEEIKAKIRNSNQWTSYPAISNGTGVEYGFVDSHNDIVRSTIVGNYDILVNPSGAGSWTEGSAESPLEAVWIAWKFRDAFTEAEMRSYISDFYSQFYGYTLSDSQITEILNGK